jgi:diaminohydroxyphosphoribosylaminopyrimidine deaminase/5-amino-6-(5-phosphoribosylamino)uracil reductase
LRATVDAIIVGANTVIRDNPRLTLRHGVRGRQPWRVVMDSRGRSPVSARLFTDRLRRRTIVITTRHSSVRWRRYLALLGIIVLVLPGERERVDLRVALRELGRMEITSVLVEGGPALLESFFDARLVDKLVFFYAPIIIGGVARVSQALRLAGREFVVEAKVGRRRAQ